MTSLATVGAYEDLDAVIVAWAKQNPEGDAERLRIRMACVLALHSCRDGSFAQCYAWEDLMQSLYIDTYPMPSFRHHPRLWCVVAWSRIKERTHRLMNRSTVGGSER